MNDVLAAAILQAQADGDTEAVARLRAMAADPEALAHLLASLRTG